MPGEGEGREIARGQATQGQACRSGASSSSSQPSLDFVGKMKTFHTSIDIPGTTAMVPSGPQRFRAALAHVMAASTDAHCWTP